MGDEKPKGREAAPGLGWDGGHDDGRWTAVYGVDEVFGIQGWRPVPSRPVVPDPHAPILHLRRRRLRGSRGRHDHG